MVLKKTMTMVYMVDMDTAIVENMDTEEATMREFGYKI